METHHGQSFRSRVTPTNEEWGADDPTTANARVVAHGGKYLARTARHERVEGDCAEAALRLLIEWPSKEAALAFSP